MDNSISYAETTSGKKTVTYKVSLPHHPKDWTVDTLRKFVQDADAQGILGTTHVKIDHEARDLSYAFGAEGSRYDYLMVERTVEL